MNKYITAKKTIEKKIDSEGCITLLQAIKTIRPNYSDFFEASSVAKTILNLLVASGAIIKASVPFNDSVNLYYGNEDAIDELVNEIDRGSKTPIIGNLDDHII